MRRMAQDTLPDYHFLLIAPNLGAEWFYEAARLYWLRFLPTVISSYTLLPLIPEEYSIAVTVVARRDIVAQLGVELARVVPRALFDPVVHDFYEDTRAELERRALANEPFGVTLQPTPTWTPAPTSPPVFPTPGPITSEEAGLTPTSTQTETETATGTATLPESTPEVTPEATASETETATPGTPASPTPPTPLYPTPGPVTGGSG